MSSIEIRKIGITKLHVDAVVNAANSGLKAGGGVCGAIFKEAGYVQLQTACDRIGYCAPGHAVVTPAFKLPSKYIIHAVGPKWIDGNHNEAQLLYSCYREALRSASKNGCHSIAFPLISSGIYGYPKEQAWRKAIQSCRDYIDNNPEEDIDIVFAVIDDQMYCMGKQTLSEIAPQHKKELDLQGIHGKEEDTIIGKDDTCA